VSESTLNLAPADQPLGQLQRGRGAGWLAARVSPDEAQSWLVECISQDPRWDHQVEDRSEYYGRIALEIGLPVQPLEDHLFASSDRTDTDEWRTGLTLWTLSVMGRFGYPDAVPLLRRYVEFGWNWLWAIAALAEIDDDSAFNGLDDIILARFPDDEELSTALGFVVATEKPWSQWRRNKRIDAHITRQEQRAASIEAARRESKTAATMELLAKGSRADYRELKTRTDSEDVKTIVHAARDGELPVRHAAIVTLGYQQNVQALPIIESVLLGDHGPHDSLAIAARRSLRMMRSNDAAVELGRKWITSTSEDLSWAGETILSDRGDPADVPIFRTVLRRGIKEAHIYRMCNAVEALHRAKDADMLAEVEGIFVSTQYSYLRKRCAQILADLSADFTQRFAFECLWDCEPETRIVGCRCAADSPETLERLHQLITPRYDTDEVSEAARARIHSTKERR